MQTFIPWGHHQMTFGIRKYHTISLLYMRHNHSAVATERFYCAIVFMLRDKRVAKNVIQFQKFQLPISLFSN